MSRKPAIRGAEMVRAALGAPYARVFYAEEEGGYSAAVLEFPGCYSSGESAAEAMENLEDAMVVWMEVHLEQGRELPPPIRDTEFTSRMSIQVNQPLRERIAELAAARGISQNRLIGEMLTAGALETAGESNESLGRAPRRLA